MQLPLPAEATLIVHFRSLLSPLSSHTHTREHRNKMCSLLFSSSQSQCFSPCFHILPSICFSSLCLSLSITQSVWLHTARAPTQNAPWECSRGWIYHFIHRISCAGVQKVTKAEIVFPISHHGLETINNLYPEFDIFRGGSLGVGALHFTTLWCLVHPLRNIR